MKHRKLFTLLALAVIMLSASAFSKSGAFSETYQAKESVQIKAKVGSLELKSWDRDEILVECDYEFSGGLYLDPVIRERKNRLTIKADIEGRYTNSYRSSVLWTLTVPVGTEVEFHSTSGGVEVIDFDGEFEGNTASGSVEIYNSGGEFHFNTASGSIEIENSNGYFDLNTASGRVSADRSTGTFRLNSASGRVSINEITLKDASSFSTASGDAFVSLAETPEFDLKVTSASGDATVDFNGNDVQGYIEMRAHKRHGKIKAPFDFDDVRLEKYRGRDSDFVIKSVTLGNDDPVIEIATASGRASLKK